ncbi:hypothetical protein AC629_40750 [Bradyrhizobium sp. NAS80.1]|uniref:hypothetical protein n=1 Tax=Bradyrhizobium sp. NAS80.1 TaxID=1680159 RepID=UPI000962EB6A|nr:hypothetical protein [Bradyrhizobium sp. NAS80.1]OKO70138.1 hypothetical protein AC629_40750 [Bradyrhizobium sp. NAS80.1]
METDLNSYLERAERCIVIGETTVTRQLALLERLRHANLPTGDAERLLREMELTLHRFYAEREKIMGR